jgi:hypothetical protein
MDHTAPVAGDHMLPALVIALEWLFYKTIMVAEGFLSGSKSKPLLPFPGE